MGEDSFTLQPSGRTQTPHPVWDPEGSDGLGSTVGNKTRHTLITYIRATGVTVRLRCIPIGFYVAVKTEDGINRTSNKPALVGKDMIEWDDKIVLPSDPSSKISLIIFASFELGPTLGDGKAIREFETTVGELLDRLESVISLKQNDGRGDSLYSSFEVRIEQQVCGRKECTAAPNQPELQEMHKLEDLTNRGHHALDRYREHQEQRDLDETIKYFEHAQDLCPLDHPDCATVLFNLATVKLMRCRMNEESSDFDVPINLYRDALRLRPLGHPDHPFTLLSLGVALEARFQRYGGEQDEMEGELHLSKVLDIAQMDSHAYHAALLALNSTAPPELIHPPETSPNVQNEFGDDGHQEVQRLDAALQRIFYPDSWTHVLFDHLGILFCIPLDRLGDLGDSEKAASVLEIVVQTISDDHPNKLLWLNALGISSLACYEHFEDLDDLEKSISTFGDAMRLIPNGHPDKPQILNNLSRSLIVRYEHFCDVVDLEKSISLLQDAVQSTPDSHPNKPLRLDNLAYSLSIRYNRFKNVVDMERSISLRQDAVRFTPDDHPDKSSWLNNLGRSFSVRYERFGNVTDLEKSTSLFEDALKLTPDDHPSKPSWITNLGDSFLSRYERFADVVDLERSISLFEDAVQFTPDGHSNKPLRLSNLGESLLTRYGRFGAIADLKKAISLLEDAVQLTHDGHADKPIWLNNLGRSLSTRYERLGDTTDLERSISLFEDAVRHTPNEHSDKVLWLNNLSQSLWTRYERFGDDNDLERSISLSKEVVRFTPEGHPDKPSWLSNLGNLFFTRYESLRDVADLEKSVSIFESVVRATPDDHPDKPSRLSGLALSLFERYQLSSDLSNPDFSQALLYSSLAARSHTGPPLRRFRASQLWILCLRLLRDESQSLLDAYTVNVDLLSQLAWMGSSLHDRYHQLCQAIAGTCEAAAAALDVYQPELAVEWLEQGRSIMWTQLSQLHAPIDNLRTVYPEFAAQFEHVSRELERVDTGDGFAAKEPTNHSDMMGGSLEEQAQQYHVLALSRERLLAEIRALPGFERFLLPKTIGQLSSWPHSGPIVFLNATKHRCDALVVMAGSEHVIHVPLSRVKYDEVAGMQLRLNQLLNLKGRDVLREDKERGGRVQNMTPDDVFRSILPYLWEKVVDPILKVLAFSMSNGKLPRIFWCPTGPFSFLPIHAAGIYSTTNPGPKLPDFAISSYIPAMSVLELPCEDSETTLRNTRLLAVPQPSTDGQIHLANVQGEIEIIRKLASSSPFVDFQESDGTVEDVLLKMTNTDWAHFACHGTQDRASPFDSGFLLAHGKRLKLPDIARVSRRHGGLAFLSACYTATGDEQLSEEAIHIAAGMLLAGYRSVIATMWSIMDDDAPRVAEDVYKSLFGNGKVPDSAKAAEALHDAIEQFRDSGTSFLSWVPFIHVGV